ESDYQSAKEILASIVEEIAKRGEPFRGALQGSFMVGKTGVVFLDVRSALGNPEGINFITLLDTQLPKVLMKIAGGNLDEVIFRQNATVVKYAVAEGYPAKSGKTEISLDESQGWKFGAKYFMNSTIMGKNGAAVCNSGRCIAVLAEAEKTEVASEMVERAFDGVHGKLKHRGDVGTRHFLFLKEEHARKMGR
ncbi:MAG: hypothetical protein HZA83_01475, partial [Thaumarchaeota archaeon]|nr:hypothetical protein [Nitrososphaerota archaeon]